MLSELECGICYQMFNTTSRCPRQLECKHSFCESCLLTLAACRQDEPRSGPRIICAFCRHATTVNEDKLGDTLPVDENILDLLEAEGLPEEREDDEEPRTETSSQSEDDPLPRTRRGRLWKPIKRLYKKMKGRSQPGCITDSEVRDLALMTCYMM